MEGPKVLFRFSLAVLKIHEHGLLQKRDTISIMRHLKCCAKLTYDVEGLMKVRRVKRVRLCLFMAAQIAQIASLFE